MSCIRSHHQREEHPCPARATSTSTLASDRTRTSLAVRNNGGTPPSAEPAPPGRREALLVLSFGGPEGPDDVLPFLENVTRAGASRASGWPRWPSTTTTSAVSADQRPEQGAHRRRREGPRRRRVDLPVYWGNRNWEPYVEDAWQQMADDGIEHVYVFATSAYASASGCRQYHEDIARARAATGPGPTAQKLPHYFDAPGFVTANADALAAALAGLPDDVRGTARLVATAHSIPNAMAAVAGPDGGAYEAGALYRRGWSTPSSPGGRSISCGRAAAVRRRCRGWSPT